MQRRTLLAAALATPFLRRTAYAATELVVHFPMPAFLKDVAAQPGGEVACPRKVCWIAW